MMAGPFFRFRFAGIAWWAGLVGNTWVKYKQERRFSMEQIKKGPEYYI